RVDRYSRTFRSFFGRDSNAVDRWLPREVEYSCRAPQLSSTFAGLLRLYRAADSGWPCLRRARMDDPVCYYRRRYPWQAGWQRPSRKADRAKLARIDAAWRVNEYAWPDGTDCPEYRLRHGHSLTADFYDARDYGAGNDNHDWAITRAFRRVGRKAKLLSSSIDFIRQLGRQGDPAQSDCAARAQFPSAHPRDSAIEN